MYIYIYIYIQIIGTSISNFFYKNHHILAEVEYSYFWYMSYAEIVLNVLVFHRVADTMHFFCYFFFFSFLIFFYLFDLIYIWGKVFKNGPSAICGRQPLKKLKWYGLLVSNILEKKTQKVFTNGTKYSRMDQVKFVEDSF